MTVILPFGRAVTRQLSSRSNQLLTRLSSSNSLIRASWTSNDGCGGREAQVVFPSGKTHLFTVRGYADDAAPKSRGRPKGQTGKTSTKKTSSKSKPAAGSKKGRQTKAKAKAALKKKPQSKPAPRPRAKRPLSKVAINKARAARNRDLKEKALLTEPKQLPSSVWLVYTSENRDGVKSLQENQARMTELSESFKHLAPEEHERLNHVANQNLVKNRSEYKKWVESHTPTEIRAANNARRTLSAEKKVKEGKKKATVHLIKDDRLVKRPRSPFAFFTADRWASGDFRKMPIPECARLIGREWKALSASERKTYEDQGATDLARYQEEHTTVYGVAPAPTPKKKST